MMRNLKTLLPDNQLWLGTPLVGTLAENIPSGSLLYDAAQTQTGHLIRLYRRSVPSNIYINEDGTYTVT